MSDHGYKTIELTGSSTSSSDDAIRNAIAKAGETLHHLRWFEVLETRGHIEDTKVAHWQVTLKVGFSLEGQGQYTVATQLLADWFKVPMEDVRVVPLDSVAAPPHFGPGGSRLGVALTGAILGACQLLTEKMLKVASGLLQTPLEACEFCDGAFRVKGMPEAKVGLTDIAGVEDVGARDRDEAEVLARTEAVFNQVRAMCKVLLGEAESVEAVKPRPLRHFLRRRAIG